MASAMAAQFWNEEVESTRSLEAVVRALPAEPPPLAMVRASKLSRSQQLLLSQRLLRLPFTPSLAPDLDGTTPSGGVVLDRVLASVGGTTWWTTLTGRFNVQRFLQRQKSALQGDSRDNIYSQLAKNSKCLLDQSLYALCARSKVLLGPSTSLSIGAEVDSLECLPLSVNHTCGTSRPLRVHAKLSHKLQHHGITMEAAWHERFLDGKTQYWDIPQVLSADIASSGINSGLHYRVGVHHSSGALQKGVDLDYANVPQGALPGTCARAAISLGKKFHMWKESGQRKIRKPYRVLAAWTQLTLSGLVGGVLNANLGRNMDINVQATQSHDANTAGFYEQTVAADIFASAGITAQVGRFQRFLLDHTKVVARIDLGRASALTSALSSSFSLSNHTHDSATVAISLKQQVIGPFCARLDSRFALDASLWRTWSNLQEITYGFDCSLESLGAAKLVAWYSPTRGEGMAEIRLLER